MSILSRLTNVPSTNIDPSNTFFDIGIKSKDTLQIASDLEELIGKSVFPGLFWEYPKINDFCRSLVNKGNGVLKQYSANDVGNWKMSEPIAVVGMACRFPGADSLEEFWNLLAEGKNAVSFINEHKKPWWFENKRDYPEAVNHAGIISDVDRFDYQYFNIPLFEAQKIDPQQRIILEVLVEAFEDAGFILDDYVNESVGVFVGIHNSDYGRKNIALHESDLFDISGNAFSICANRISYLFGFTGPSIAVDTACSSSLTALHLACQSLRSQESNFAIVGGVNLIFDPQLTVGFAKANMLSRTGQCHTFDANADGFVRGEGAGIILLKPFSQAVLNGDKIYAFLHATTINQDGFSNGLTAPNPIAQEQLLHRAASQAQITPEEIQYIELHGTGTALGDPIEAYAIGNFLSASAQNPRKDKCLVGSVKTNIGHLESAAGIAGFIKTALSLSKGFIPPSLNFKTPNPLIPFETAPFEVNTKLSPYPTGIDQWFAGVSSFGFGGTNAHAILSNLPNQKNNNKPQKNISRFNQSRKLCFVFSGFSGFDFSKCQSLIQSSPYFKKVIEECDHYIQEFLSWSLLEKLLNPEALFNTASLAFPAILSLQIALAKLWISLDIQPEVVIGHSMGEISAAHLSGAITLCDAMRIICYIADAMHRFPANGGMVVVELSCSEAKKFIVRKSLENVFVAAHNTSSWSVLSGEKTAILEAQLQLEKQKIRVEMLPLDHAYHTSLVDEKIRWILKKLETIQTGTMAYPLFSSAKKGFIHSQNLDLNYWFDMLTNPVYFYESFNTLIDEYHLDTFLEVNPNITLGKMLSQELITKQNKSSRIFSYSLDRENGKRPLSDVLEQLCLWGIHIDWQSVSQLKKYASFEKKAYLVPFSAHSQGALEEWIKRCRSFLLKEKNESVSLADFSFNVANRRAHYKHRVALLSTSKKDLLQQLEGLEQQSSNFLKEESIKKIAFVFSGQGNQWAGMAKEFIAQEPIFKCELLKIDKIFKIQSNWSMVDVLTKPSAQHLASTAVMQPVIFSVQVAFSKLLSEWGISPDGVIGHSMGEIAAAYIAEHINLKEAVRLIYLRGKILENTKGLGAMLAVRAKNEEVVHWMQESQQKLFISAINSDKTMIVSGRQESISNFSKFLKNKNCVYKRLDNDYPFHSPIIDEVVELEREGLEKITPKEPKLFHYKTAIEDVKCQKIDSTYWQKNILNRVNFHAALQEMLQDGYDTFIEIGVDQILSESILQTMNSCKKMGNVFSVMKKKEDSIRRLYSVASALYHSGINLNWKKIYSGYRQHIDLPHYPWQREICWLGSSCNSISTSERQTTTDNEKNETINISSLEDKIINILCMLLNRPTIDSEKSFISLGGNSLIATQFLLKVERSLGLTISLKTIFSKSIREIIENIKTNYMALKNV